MLPEVPHSFAECYAGVQLRGSVRVTMITDDSKEQFCSVYHDRIRRGAPQIPG